MGLNCSLNTVPAWPQTDSQQEVGAQSYSNQVNQAPVLSISFETPWKLFFTFQFTDISEMKLRAFTSYLTKVNQSPNF